MEGGVGKGKMSLEGEERKENGWSGGGKKGRNEVGRGRKEREEMEGREGRNEIGRKRKERKGMGQEWEIFFDGEVREDKEWGVGKG